MAGPHGMRLSAEQAVRAATEGAERERRQARVDAALQQGWTIRFDPARDEYSAAKELHTARDLGVLLDAIEAAGDD